MVREKWLLCETKPECLQNWLCLCYIYSCFSVASNLIISFMFAQNLFKLLKPIMVLHLSGSHFPPPHTYFNCGYCTGSFTVSRHQPSFDGCQVLVLLAFSRGEGCLEQISSLLCFQQVITPAFTQPSPALALHQYCHLLKALSFVLCCYAQMIFNLDPREALPFVFICMSERLGKNKLYFCLFILIIWNFWQIILSISQIWDMM